MDDGWIDRRDGMGIGVEGYWMAWDGWDDWDGMSWSRIVRCIVLYW